MSTVQPGLPPEPPRPQVSGRFSSSAGEPGPPPRPALHSGLPPPGGLAAGLCTPASLSPGSSSSGRGCPLTILVHPGQKDVQFSQGLDGSRPHLQLKAGKSPLRTFFEAVASISGHLPRGLVLVPRRPCVPSARPPNFLPGRQRPPTVPPTSTDSTSAAREPNSSSFVICPVSLSPVFHRKQATQPALRAAVLLTAASPFTGTHAGRRNTCARLLGASVLAASVPGNGESRVLSSFRGSQSQDAVQRARGRAVPVRRSKTPKPPRSRPPHVTRQVGSRLGTRTHVS